MGASTIALAPPKTATPRGQIRPNSNVHDFPPFKNGCAPPTAANIPEKKLSSQVFALSFFGVAVPNP